MSDTAVVAADRGLLNVVLRELLANASRHVASDDNGKLPVKIETQSTSNTAILQIRNRIANAEFSEQLLPGPSPRLWSVAGAKCGYSVRRRP